MAKRLCYARPTRRSWPLKQGLMGYIFHLKEDLKQKITTWQREVDLKLMKSVWGAHVRTTEEDKLSEGCVCEPLRVPMLSPTTRDCGTRTSLRLSRTEGYDQGR